jgi:hypothetical protein
MLKVRGAHEKKVCMVACLRGEDVCMISGGKMLLRTSFNILFNSYIKIVEYSQIYRQYLPKIANIL